MTLSLALFGCGVMGRRHIAGLRRLRDAGRLHFELAAVCDLIPAAGEAAASLAVALLGLRPAVFADLDAVRRGIPGLDAIIITTAPDTHAGLGVAALRAGLHVLCEKPLALTVRQGRALIEAAEAAGRTLAVAENYRRDPINRLAKALIEAGAIGRPFLIVQSSSGGADEVIITPWRHRRQRCGIIVDMGVHYTDLFEYFLGPVEAVTGFSAQVDPRRQDAAGAWHAVDAEDLSAGVARFRSGAVGHWLLSLSGCGEGHFSRVIYGTGGSLVIPPDRSGQPLRLTPHGAAAPLEAEALLALAPDFRLDPTTAALFGGERLASYDLSWAAIDANLLAIEQDDFAEAIRGGRLPEVDGMGGLRALALVYGFLEAERQGRAISADELVAGTAHAYQSELVDELT